MVRLLPALAERLGELPPGPALEPEQARFRLFDAVTGLLKRAAESEPLLLVLDDLHWADRSSLLLLRFVARELHDARVLVVGTYRDLGLERSPQAEPLVALVLAASLREAGAVPQALAGFAARRSPRTGWVRAQTHRRDRTRGLPPALRNFTLRAFGRRIFHSQYAPLRSDC